MLSRKVKIFRLMNKILFYLLLLPLLCLTTSQNSRAECAEDLTSYHGQTDGSRNNVLVYYKRIGKRVHWVFRNNNDFSVVVDYVLGPVSDPTLQDLFPDIPTG